MRLKTRRFAQRAREIAVSLRGLERLAVMLGAASLARALLEGASLTLLVPFLESFRPDAESRLRLIALVVGVLVLLRAGASYLTGILSTRLQVRVLVRLRETLAAALYRSRYADIAALGAGKLVNLFSLQTDRVVGGISSVVSLANAVLLLAVYGAALLLLSWRLSVAAVVLGAIGLGVAFYAGRRIRDHSVRMVQAEEDSSRVVLDDGAGLHVIQAYDIARERLALHRAVNERVYRETVALHRWRTAVRPVTEALYTVALLGAVWLGLSFWPERLFASVPLILAFAFVLLRIQGQFASISEAMSFLAEQEGVTLNVFALLTENTEGPDGIRSAPAGFDRVSVEGVEFAYPAGLPILRDLSLDLHRGEMVAVVGASGVGKSTLVQLLLRLRLPLQGQITVDGVALKEFSRASLARSVGVVFEDSFVFDESVEWNISLGRQLDASAVRRAARAAGLDDVIEHLPRGLESLAGSRGARLSAGQRQRVALARALASTPRLLILDEATSALDGPTDHSIAQTLRLLRPEGITLLIAHRLSTVLAADRIVVLEDGRVGASGTHGDLLATSETYRKLVETQLIPDAGWRTSD